MTALLPIRHRDDVLPAYRGTPVADLVAYHNLRSPHRSYDQAKILIGMCMDSRIALRIPDNFAYILRAGGGNLQRIEFKVSYAVAVGGVRTICLIGHDQCGMVGLRARRDVFVNGLVKNGGWARREAEQHFDGGLRDWRPGGVRPQRSVAPAQTKPPRDGCTVHLSGSRRPSLPDR